MADEAATTTTDAAAETSGDDTANTTTVAATETDPPGAEALGDAGKRALDTMKAERKAARDEAAALKAQLDALQAKVDGREAEFTASQESQRVKDEALGLANERIKKAEVRAAAKGKVADEALADLPLLMDLSSIEVGADGEVDASQIAAAINDLITSKPYLAAQGGRFQGSADGGARNDASRPTQLSESDMGRMTPEQIAEAEAAGRFDRVLGRS